MIVAWIVRAVASFASFVAGLIPTVPVPSWLTDADGAVATIAHDIVACDPWFPFSLVPDVFGAMAACVGVALTIRVVRIVASFLTAGGGSAA